MPNLAALITEARNPASEHIDELSTFDMLALINREDASVAAAVAAELPSIAKAVDAIADCFTQGGRLFYIGAGTSGRLGVLDASECPPTFSVPPTLFQGLIAGGDPALRISSEHSEDSPEEGVADLTTAGFGLTANASLPVFAKPSDTSAGPAKQPPKTHDVLVGISTSGRTPYVLGALLHARSLGALTVGISCVADSSISKVAAISIAPLTGPEVITGSTRMKAGTATKLVLNMLSTGVMIRTGAVYGNLMVNLKPTNDKLIDRAHRIIMVATGCDRYTATRLLYEAGTVKTAIAMQLLKLDRQAAETRLAQAKGSLSKALHKDG